MNTATQAGNFEIGKILRLPAFFVCKKRREKTLNIAKLTDWALRLDHPPWTASKGRGKQRFRRILTPLDISCRCCPYRYNESTVRKPAVRSARPTGTSTIPVRFAAPPESASSATDAAYSMRTTMSSGCSPLPEGQTEEDNERIPQPDMDRSSRFLPAGDSRTGKYMEQITNRTTTPKTELPEEPRQSKIIIRRTFGDQNLLELYADYVAGKVMEEMRRAREPVCQSDSL